MRALITGASSGLGYDFACELAKMGYDLVIAARREDRLLELKSRLSTDVTVITADLSKESECRRVFEEAGKIDLLINNAGFGVFGEFTQTELEKELSMIDVNIKALHILTKLYLCEFEKQGSGKILNVASSAAFAPGPMFSSYYASKAYVYRLTLAIDRELKDRKSNSQISVLCPGPVKTEFDKVAKVSFGIGSLESIDVVKYTLKKFFKGKTVIVPGFAFKAMRFFSKLVPEQLSCRIAGTFQKSKKKMAD